MVPSPFPVDLGSVRLCARYILQVRVGFLFALDEVSLSEYRTTSDFSLGLPLHRYPILGSDCSSSLPVTVLSPWKGVT